MNDFRLYHSALMDEDALMHWGIQGMKWGIRRYQNEDGTLTPEGKKRYKVNSIEEYEIKRTAKKQRKMMKKVMRQNRRLNRRMRKQQKMMIAGYLLR